MKDKNDLLFEMIDLDTQLFEIPVAKIIPSRLSSPVLNAILRQLKQLGVKLVYWCSDRNDRETQGAAQAHHGFLSDEKITYVVDLDAIAMDLQHSSWEFYDDPTASSELVELALSIGRLSRFSKDPRIGQTRLEKMYTLWINNACNHSVAEGVIIIKKQGEIRGMVTVGEKKQRGDIGLLSVSPSHQGQGYGVQLVRKAQAYFLKKGYHQVQVVTQNENRPACKLYEKCDFKIESIEHYYHFWL